MLKKYIDLLISNLKTKGVPYLCVGIFNTFFGIALYTVFILVLGERHYLLLGMINNVISITFAFLLHKIFVFKTKGNYLKEYLKFCSVYLSSSAFGIIIMFLLVDILGIPAIISNILLTTILIGYSFVGNILFAFKQ